MKLTHTLLFCLVTAWWCQAQSYYTLEGVNGTRASFRSDGLLFSDGQGGGFELEEGGGAFLKRAGLSIIGFSPSVFFQGAITPIDSTLESDFAPGFLSTDGTEVFGANQFWAVTREEVIEHITDYYEDGIVDNPIASIFSWPGRDNPLFETYNGYEIPEGKELAPFWDENFNGIYEPQKGDYPMGALGSCGQINYNLVWFAYHSKSENLPSGLMAPHFEIHTTASTLDCDLEPILDKTVFVKHTIYSIGPELIDSTFFGLFLDMSIGCPGNEYMGSDPSESAIFAYNATFEEDTCSDSLNFEGPPPVFVAKQLRGPEDENGNFADWSVFMPILEDSGDLPIGMRPPQNVVEYYHNINGSWRDGSPLTFGGNGYQSSNQEVKAVFSDPPYLPNGWSERAENFDAGNRKAIVAAGPIRFDEGTVQTIIYSFTVINDSVADTIDGNFERLYTETPYLRPFISCSFRPGLRYFDCDSSTDLPVLSSGNFQLLLSPNPATDEVLVTINNAAIQQMITVYDVTGIPVIPTITFLGNTITLDVSELTAGIYFVEARNPGGRAMVKKLLKL